MFDGKGELKSAKYQLQGGVVLHNLQDIGAVDTVNFTVPLGRKWLPLGGKTERDVNAAFYQNLYDPGPTNMIMAIDGFGAGVTTLSFPEASNINAASGFWGRCWLQSGWVLQYSYGVAQTNPEVSLVVLEV